jgi:peptidoglycan-N-acetylglucosamine deacetylase
MMTYPNYVRNSVVCGAVAIGALVTLAGATYASGQAISRIETDKKIVALTFDDGPTPPFTTEVLNILKKHNIKATFFVTGQNANAHHDIIRRIQSEGHEIGNHSWSHPMMKFRSMEFIRKQIESTDRIIRKLGYEGEIHFRSPYAVTSGTLTKTLKSLNKDNILFNVDPTDWRKPSSAKITKRIMKQVHPGSIILMHDGGGDRKNTVQALEGVIENLSKDGYEFVTVSGLLDGQVNSPEKAETKNPPLEIASKQDENTKPVTDQTNEAESGQISMGN